MDFILTALSYNPVVLIQVRIKRKSVMPQCSRLWAWGVDATFLSLIITLEENPLVLHASRWEDKGGFSFNVGLLWLSSSCSWNTFVSASHLFNQLKNPGWIDSCETFCFVLLLQIGFKTLLNLLGCTNVFSQVFLLEREFSTLLWSKWFFV